MEVKRLHDTEYCFECDRPAVHTHHMIFGKNRANSEKYGLTIKLCAECHRRLHDRDEKMAMRYRKMAQAAFEYKYSHEEYMKIFGRSYL